MALEFRPPTEIIDAYNRRKNPGLEVVDEAQQAMQLYAQMKAQQQNQSLKQQQNDLLAKQEARQGREQFFNYADTESLSPEVQSALGQPQIPSLIDRYNKFIQENPQGLKGQQFTEDTILQKDEKGNIIGQSTSRRPVKGKTLMTGPAAIGQQYNMDKPQQVPGMTDPSGNPLQFVPSRGYEPAPVAGGIKPVNRKGDESSIGDATLMAQQLPNVDKLFDAYKTKPGVMGRVQATGLGGVLDPETKQFEDSLKLTAFTFGGKNLTGQEKEVVFGAMFPSWKDNDASREQKRSILKNFYTGKIDLMQAANLLGPAGAPLQQMLHSKLGGQTTAPTQQATTGMEHLSDEELQRIANGG
jgi:hypothetical protein